MLTFLILALAAAVGWLVLELVDAPDADTDAAYADFVVTDDDRWAADSIALANGPGIVAGFEALLAEESAR